MPEKVPLLLCDWNVTSGNFKSVVAGMSPRYVTTTFSESQGILGGGTWIVRQIPVDPPNHFLMSPNYHVLATNSCPLVLNEEGLAVSTPRSSFVIPVTPICLVSAITITSITQVMSAL